MNIIIKIGPNYFYLLKILLFGFAMSIYPCFVIIDVITGYSSASYLAVIVMFIILILSLITMLYAILGLFKNHIQIDQNKIIISSVLNKKDVLIDSVIRVERVFQKNRDTSFFGKTTYKILTTKKTITVTSENYASLDKLLTYLSKNKERKENEN